MNEQEMRIQQLMREVEKGKRLAVRAANKACFECDSEAEKVCRKCPIHKIREEADNR